MWRRGKERGGKGKSEGWQVRACRELHLKINVFVKIPSCSKNWFPFLLPHSAQGVTILMGHCTWSGVRISPDCQPAPQGPKLYWGLSDPTCLPGTPATASYQALLPTTLRLLVPLNFHHSCLCGVKLSLIAGEGRQLP